MFVLSTFVLVISSYSIIKSSIDVMSIVTETKNVPDFLLLKEYPGWQ